MTQWTAKQAEAWSERHEPAMAHIMCREIPEEVARVLSQYMEGLMGPEQFKVSLGHVWDDWAEAWIDSEI